jgi:RNA polymerase sigma factor (sigma-70 family)
MDTEDALLIEQYLAGDPSAFDRLVGAHQDRVARLAYRLLGWSDDVEDVVQEVFLAAMKNLRTFRGQCRLSTWLTTITVNKCRSHRRRMFLHGAMLRRLLEGPAPASGASAPNGPQEAERLAAVRQAVRQLPAKYREVVVLRYLEEMPVAEVGRALGVSEGAVSTRLNRARALLKDRLEDPEEPSHGRQ